MLLWCACCSTHHCTRRAGARRSRALYLCQRAQIFSLPNLALSLFLARQALAHFPADD